MGHSDYLLRPAISQDIWSIRRLVFFAGLEPTQLRWSQFWVAELDSRIIACGQLRMFKDAQELGSLVVAKRFRHQGIGRHLTQHLIAEATQPLYLECLGQGLVEFYERLGFIKVELMKLPPDLRGKFVITNRIASVLRLPLYLMQYRPQ